MPDSRKKNVNWDVSAQTFPAAQLAVLMDIRDELKIANENSMRIVAVLECRNAWAIPHTLTRIEKLLKPKVPRKPTTKAI